jgi:hypothetical protein
MGCTQYVLGYLDVAGADEALKKVGAVLLLSSPPSSV